MIRVYHDKFMTCVYYVTYNIYIIIYMIPRFRNIWSYLEIIIMIKTILFFNKHIIMIIIYILLLCILSILLLYIYTPLWNTAITYIYIFFFI